MTRFILFAIACFALLLAGCLSGGEPQASASANSTAFEKAPAQDLERGIGVKNGDTVKVDYVGSLENGTVFDTSLQAEAKKAGLPARPSYSPLEFTLGQGQLIAGFEKAVLGMKVGEEKTVKFPPSEGYGEVNPAAIVTVNRTVFGNNSANLTVGMQVGSAAGVGTVTALNDSSVTVDFNSPLAGKTLVFRIILRAITPAGK